MENEVCSNINKPNIMQTLQITIPKPCHEDWNKMSTEERGRFCSKCSKTVLDFSKKTTNEVQQFIIEHQDEKLCGRFRNDQLTNPVKLVIPLEIFRRQLSASQIFLISLFIFFGTALFSCTAPQNQKVGEIVIDNGELSIQYNSDENYSTMGLFIPMDSSHLSDTITQGAPVVLKGELSFIPDIPDTLPIVEVIQPETSFACYTLGMVISEIKEVDEIGHDSAFKAEETVSEENTSSFPELKSSGTNKNNEVFIYPNPTNGFFNLQFTTKEEKTVKADLIDMNRKIIRTLISLQKIPAENTTLQININDQAPGIYLVRMLIGDKIYSERIVLR